jgi:hypothetical protein
MTSVSLLIDIRPWHMSVHCSSSGHDICQSIVRHQAMTSVTPLFDIRPWHLSLHCSSSGHDSPYKCLYLGFHRLFLLPLISTSKCGTSRITISCFREVYNCALSGVVQIYRRFGETLHSFYSEDGDSAFLRNAIKFQVQYTASHMKEKNVYSRGLQNIIRISKKQNYTRFLPIVRHEKWQTKTDRRLWWSGSISMSLRSSIPVRFPRKPPLGVCE